MYLTFSGQNGIKCVDIMREARRGSPMNITVNIFRVTFWNGLRFASHQNHLKPGKPPSSPFLS